MATNTTSTNSASPAPLLADKAGSLQKGSQQQQFAATFLSNVAGTAVSGAKSAGNIADQISVKSINFTQQLARVSNVTSESIQGASSSVAGGIAGLGEGIVHDIQGWKSEVNKMLEPVSTHIGSTIGAVENVVRNPLGAPQMLADATLALMDKISPGFSNSLEGTAKSLQLESLANLPGQVMGSIRSLTLAADQLLSVPFMIVSDIYNGLMDIMEEIANLIDGVCSAIFDFFFGPGGLLDSILPISEILSLLEAVGTLASFVGGISQLAGGFTMITNLASQVTSFTSSFSSMISNPLQLAQSYVPGFDQALGGISQVTGMLRNPEQLLQGALPPEISSQLKNISSIPGLGFVSNFGTSIGSTLDGLKGGVFTKAIDQFGQEYSSLLGPLFNQQAPGTNVGTGLDPQESFAGAYQDFKYGTGAQGNQGVIMQGPGSRGAYKIFEQRTKGQRGSTTATFNGTTITEEANGAVLINGMGNPYGISQAAINAENRAARR